MCFTLARGWVAMTRGVVRAKLVVERGTRLVGTRLVMERGRRLGRVVRGAVGMKRVRRAVGVESVVSGWMARRTTSTALES